MSPEASAADRRSAPRRPARGRVRLWPESPLSRPVDASLVDVAAGGFRARHDCPALTTGQTVGFQLNRTEGRCRIVWTRMCGDHIESGFAFFPGGC